MDPTKNSLPVGQKNGEFERESTLTSSRKTALGPLMSNLRILWLKPSQSFITSKTSRLSGQ